MQQLLFRAVQRSFLGLFLLCVFAFTAVAQVGKLEVTRNVNLRSDPSTQNDSITLLHPPATLDLVATNKTNGYYHVHTDDGEDGWVWSKNVKIITNASIIQPSTTSLATSILSTWSKGTPTKSTFNGNEGPCPFDGNAFDPEQFTLKNRTDIPASYHDVTWDSLNNLPYPGKTDGTYAGKHRKDWTPTELDVIKPFEGIPVRVVGYIVAIKPQNGGSGEGTNCNFNKVGDVDTHLALVKNIGDAESTSIVIEWTPRFLKAHPTWKKSKMTPWLDSDDPVRISGWLMVDPDHVNHLNRYRGTLWEIHPITRIEVWKNGAFVDLDTLP